MSDPRAVEAVSRVLARIFAEREGGVWLPAPGKPEPRQIGPKEKAA